MEKRLDEARVEMDEVCCREYLNFIFLFGVLPLIFVRSNVGKA